MNIPAGSLLSGDLDVRKLSIKEGDILAIIPPKEWSIEQVQEFGRLFGVHMNGIAPEVRVVVLAAGMDIALVRFEELQP